MSAEKKKRWLAAQKAARAARRQARAARSSVGEPTEQSASPHSPSGPRQSDEQPVSVNSESLPRTTDSLQTELVTTGSENGTSADTSAAGGLGVRPDRDPPGWPNIRPRIRDTRLIRQLLRRKDWKVPEALHAVAPQQLVNIMLQRDIDGKPLTGDDRYTAGHRVAAIKTLQEMLRDNDRRLVAAVRLNQLERRTDVIEQHPEALGQGNTTNNVQVVVYLPEEAPLSKFELPSETVEQSDGQVQSH